MIIAQNVCHRHERCDSSKGVRDINKSGDPWKLRSVFASDSTLEGNDDGYQFQPSSLESSFSSFIGGVESPTASASSGDD